MSSFFEATIIGNLGRDPELKYTPTGKAVCTFSVATNRRYTGGDGQQVEEATWHNIEVWGKQAEACNQYLRKGREVLVKAVLKPDPATGGPRIWTRRDGTPGTSYEWKAHKVVFLGGNGGGNGSSRQAAAPQAAAPSNVPPGRFEVDEDIPF